jgi:hypothetical protein
MKNNILPIGLKGNEINERIKQLMGVQPINENKKNSDVELTKIGPDGKIYGIVRENHEYYIKIAENTKNVGIDDFKYIGGLANKKQEAYQSYAKAIKQLNLKFNSLNEAYGKSGQINVFKNDNLLNENMGFGFSNEGNLENHQSSECCGAPIYENMCSECGTMRQENFYDAGIAEYDKPAIDSFKKQYGDEEGKSIYYATANKQDRDPETFEKNEVEMNEYEEYIDGMIDDDFRKGVDLGSSFDKMKPQQIEPELTPEKKPSFLDKVKGGVEKMFNRPEDANFTPHPDRDFQDTMGYDPLSMAEEEMTDDERDFATLAEPKNRITYADKIAGARMNERKSRLSIDKAINEMDSIIEGVLDSIKKKV